MQDLNDLLFFAEVVDEGGFAAAGRKLGIPKSRLSRRIAELEQRLGVRLLQRTTRKLHLTEAGELYHRHCVAMREQAEAADDAVAQVRESPRGTIRVACPITLAQSDVGRVIAQFLVQYPEVRIEMRVTNRVIDLVDEGIDVAFRVRTRLDDSGSLVVKQLGHSQGLLVASAGQIRRQGQPRTLEELARMDTVAMSANDARRGFRLFGPGGEEHVLTLRPRYLADDLITLKAAVMQGIGLTMLPDYLCSESLANGRMVEVMPGWRPAPAILHAVFPSRRGLIPAVRRFLDYLGENIAGERLAFGSAAS